MSNYWEKKKKEKEKKEAEHKNAYGQTSDEWKRNTPSTSSGNSGELRNAFGQTYDEYRTSKANGGNSNDKYNKWKSTSNALIQEYDDYSYSGKYMTQEKHDDYYKRINEQLKQGASMREKYGSNTEEINAIVEKLSKQVQDNYEGRKYYSQWEDDETYQQFLTYQKENEDIQKAAEAPETDADYKELSKYQEPTGLKSFFRDDDYEFINDTEWSPKYSVNGNGDTSEQERKGYAYITDDERGRYNYIYNKLGKEKATEYLEGLNLTERMADAVISENQEYAKEHPVLASAESVVKNVAGGGMGFAEGAWNTITGKGIDEDSYTNLINRSSNAIRETVADGIDNEVGSFLYQTGMSMADSVAAIAATSWTGPLGLAPGTAAGFVLGSNAATNAMLSAKERGVSDGQALATGIAQGAAEMFFEKYSIGELGALKDVPVKTMKDVLGNILRQAGIEGSEEVFTSMANALTDLVINGELSENKLNVQNYVDQGYTEEEASWMAAKDHFGQLLMDFLGGAVSGGVMSSGAQAINYATRNQSLEDNTENPEEATEPTEEAADLTVENEEPITETDAQIPENEEAITQPTAIQEGTDIEEIPWEEAEMYSGELPQNISENNQKVAPAQPISNAAVEQSVQTNAPAQKTAQQTKDVHRESIKTVLTNGNVSDDLAAEIVRNDGLRNAMEEATGIKLEGTEQQKRNSVKYIAEIFAKSNGSFVNTVNPKTETTAPKIKAQASVNGSNVEIVGVKSVEGETAILEGADGKGYAVNKVNFNENASRKLYSDAASFAVIAGKDAANDYIRYYQPTMSLPAYEKTFNFFYNMGKNGVSVNTAMQAASEHVKMTSEEAAKKAWNLGLASRQRENAKVAVEKKQQKRKGTGSYTNETRTPNPMKEISMLMANKTGIDIVRKVELENGANAAFVPSMMQMFVSENAENEYAAILHEMGEFALSYNREGMKLTQEALINWWAQHEGIKGAEELDQIIDRYQQAYKKAEGSKTREQAMDEVINDALAGLFSTETGTQELIEWLKTDSGYSKGEQKTVVDYLIQAIDKIINYLKQFVRENKLSKAAQTTLQMEEQRAHEIRQQLLKAFDKAIENANTTGEYTAEANVLQKFSLNIEEYFEPYDTKQRENWKSSKKIVLYENESQFKDFVEKAKERINAGQKLYLGKIKDDIANKVKKELGHNIQGYNCALYSDNVRKIFKDHGNERKEATRGQRAIVIEDFLRIPEIICNPENIENGGLYNGNPVVKFKKDGITIVGVVIDGALDLYPQTMYAGKKIEALQRRQMNEPLSLTSGTTRSTASKNIISNISENASEEIRYSIAGVDALTADNDARIKAQNMLWEGKSELEVLKETGWYRGYDGAWRFEIDDSQMEILDVESNYMKLDQLIKHDKLFEAYPILREVDVVFQNLRGGQRGNFNRQFFTVNLNQDLKNNKKQLKETLIHEIQHVIQSEERFANGANEEYWNSRLEGGFDSRPKEIQRQEWKLRSRYLEMQEESPEFVADMEHLKEMEPNVPRGGS